MQHSPLAGYSILVVEDELFIARCLQMVLEAAGAEVHRAPSLREALDIAGQPGLSARVLDCKHGIRGDHAIARRLDATRPALHALRRREPRRHAAWPNAPVVGKLASGGEISRRCAACFSPPSQRRAVASGASAQAAHTRAMSGVDALMKRRSVRGIASVWTDHPRTAQNA